MSKLVWQLNVECTDPNVVGNPKKEKELIKRLDELYELLKKSMGFTRTYQLGLIKINRTSFVVEKGGKENGN